MNSRPLSPIPHAINKLWAFFVLGILVTTMAFIVVTWQAFQAATSHRLTVVAAAVARIEQSYLRSVAHDLIRLKTTLKALPPADRARALRRYLIDHPENVGAAILDARDHAVLAAGLFQMKPKMVRAAIPAVATLCLLHHHMCFSTPFVQKHGPSLLFARPFSPHESLVLERPLSSWPQLRQLFRRLPQGFHAFILTHSGNLEYRLPHPLKAHYGLRHGPLVRALQKAFYRRRGTFSGETRSGWRLGAYQSSRYGLITAVSLPLQTQIESFAHRLEIPLILILMLIASATLYYHYSRREIARVEALQIATDLQIRKERAFAEQQRDFYLAVTELNQFIVRHPAPDQLFAETCRIIIAYTDLLFAWIGRVEGSGDIRVVAVSEKRPLGIDWFRCLFTADPDRPEGRGPAGRCVRSGHIEITDDLVGDDRFSAWRAMHTRAGTRSAAALPIRTRAGVVAVLALGSEQLQLFSPPLIHLLEGLAQDLAFSLDDTEREEQLAHQAQHDALTGLENRTVFRVRIEKLTAASAASKGGAAIAILDLDGFKGINDQFGHIVGDELLRRVASRLQAAVPPGSSVARLGGDEFGILFSEIDEREQAIKAIEAVRWSLDPPFSAGGHEQLTVAVSIGMSLIPSDGLHVDDLIRRADLALYEAKRLGKNMYRFFTPALEERLLNRHRLQHNFAKALRDREPILYFQPQIELVTGGVRCFEALLRWPQPDGKVWAPGEYFHAIVQDTELMRRLDIYVLERAFEALRYLKREGLSLPVAINIHGPHLLHPDFLKDLQAALKDNTEHTHALEIEVTETSQLTDLTQASAVLQECRTLGVAVALDDFGTGYASLNYLQKLPCDILKIDQSFVADMADDPRDFAIVSAVLTAARVLNVATVAEGVEQVEQGALLRDLGCQYAQGYVISRPLPIGEVAEWARHWQAPLSWTKERRIPPDTSAWLARASHRVHVHRVNQIVRHGQGPVPPETLDVCRCPLHGWLEAANIPTFTTLHATVHRLMAESLLEHLDAAGTKVATLSTLQTAEEELDTWLMDYLTRGDPSRGE